MLFIGTIIATLNTAAKMMKQALFLLLPRHLLFRFRI
jgi:hypothetical protein